MLSRVGYVTRQITSRRQGCREYLLYTHSYTLKYNYLQTRYFLLLKVTVLFFVGRPLWREDGSVFFTCYGPYQCSLSRVRVRWDSRPYFTVSDLRLPFSVLPFEASPFISAVCGPSRRHHSPSFDFACSATVASGTSRLIRCYSTNLPSLGKRVC
jgi:hypothetical protein